MIKKELFSIGTVFNALNYIAVRKKFLWVLIVAGILFTAAHFVGFIADQIHDDIFIIKMLGGGERVTGVSVVEISKKTVPVYSSFVGTTSSIRKVDIRARVKGFLTEQNFKEGDFVKEGELMYVIDESPFKASLDEITAQLEKDKAQLEFANKQVERYKGLVDKEYVSREAYDKYVTDAKSSQAVVDADLANLEKAKLDLGYCRMYSPLDGRVGRTFVHVGNLVGANDETLLATIVQLDPMYVYFYPSEQQYRQIVELQNKNALTVELSFSDGTRYSGDGTVDFIDNVANQQTNTVAMRASFPNPDKILLPDVYVNVDLLLQEQADTLLVPQKAVMQGQEGSYVYIVDKNGKVQEAIIETQFSRDGQTAVKKGLNDGDRVIVDGMQKVRPGIEVEAELVQQGK